MLTGRCGRHVLELRRGIAELRRRVQHLRLRWRLLLRLFGVRGRRRQAVEVAAVGDDQRAEFQVLDVDLDHCVEDVGELLEGRAPVGVLRPALQHHVVPSEGGGAVRLVEGRGRKKEGNEEGVCREGGVRKGLGTKGGVMETVKSRTGKM